MSSFGIDNQPLRYYNGKPIYLTLYLTLALTVGIIVVVLLDAARVAPAFLAFFPPMFFHGFLWQPFTYVFVNGINFFTPFGLFCFYFWGVEVEKYLGRRRFVEICAALILVPVFYSSFLWLLGLPLPLSGDFLLIAGLLVGFATLYPDLDYLAGWIPLKWFAFACIAFGSLMHFPNHDWAGLSLLWLECAVAFGMIRFARGQFDFKFKLPQLWQKKPKLRVLPRPAETRRAYTTSAVADTPDEAEEELDGLLDKIARSGMQSLTTAERTRLETLRQKLLKKGS